MQALQEEQARRLTASGPAPTGESGKGSSSNHSVSTLKSHLKNKDKDKERGRSMGRAHATNVGEDMDEDVDPYPAEDALGVTTPPSGPARVKGGGIADRLQAQANLVEWQKDDMDEKGAKGQDDKGRGKGKGKKGKDARKVTMDAALTGCPLTAKVALRAARGHREDAGALRSRVSCKAEFTPALAINKVGTLYHNLTKGVPGHGLGSPIKYRYLALLEHFITLDKVLTDVVYEVLSNHYETDLRVEEEKASDTAEQKRDHMLKSARVDRWVERYVKFLKIEQPDKRSTDLEVHMRVEDHLISDAIMDAFLELGATALGGALKPDPTEVALSAWINKSLRLGT
jgi:hypothetical protein